MKTRTIRKTLSLLLALTLIFGVLPMSAFASEAENPKIGTITTTIATIGTTDGGEASCTCESFCSDADCVVCKDDATQCFYYYCICEAVCAEGEANADCPICKDDYSKCAQAVEVPEFEAMTASTVALDFTDANTQAIGTGYEWDDSTSTLTLTGINLNVNHTSPTITTVLKLPAGSTIDLVEGTNNNISITKSNDASTYKAIDCAGNLTIKGSGSLTINSQNGGSGGSIGIFSSGAVTIEGGTIEIAGHDLSSQPQTPVAAIYTGGDFNITGGTVIAKSSNRVFKSDYVVPAGHSYWKSTDPESPGGLKHVSTADTTNDKIDDSIKNLKIVPGPNYTLVLNDTDGRLYKNDPSTGDDVTTVMANSGAVVTGSAGARILTLTEFDFKTSCLLGGAALKVPDGTTIMMVGENKITSTNSAVPTAGIMSAGTVTFSGSGSLTANGGTYDQGSIGIAADFIISSGTVIAAGGTRALGDDYVVPAGYSYWRSIYRTDPADEVTVSTGSEAAHKIGSMYKYAKIVANGPNYTLYYNSTDNTMRKDGLTGDIVTTDDVSGWSGDGATLTLSGIDFETTAEKALVVPANTTIMLAAGTTSTITSTSNGTDSYGIKSTGSSLTVSGSGSLTASGGTNVSWGIGTPGVLSITGGTITLKGAHAAINGTPSITKAYEYKTGAYGDDLSGGNYTPGPLTGFGSYQQIVINVASINYTLLLYNENGRLYKNDFEGTDVTDEMAAAGAVVSGSFGARTLTLTDFEFETSAATALIVPGGTTINVIGDNTIETTATSESVSIICPGTLKINGTGSLNAVSNGTGLGYPAIVAGSLTVEGSPAITATTGTDIVVLVNTGDLNMTGGTLIATSASASGHGLWVQAGDLTMTGGTIYAKNGTVAALVSGNVPENVVVKGRSGDAFDVDAMFSASPTGNITTTPEGFPNFISDAKITVSGASPTPTPAPSSGGSSGGSSKKEEPAKPIITPMDDKSSGTLNTAIDSAADAATNSTGKDLSVILKNVSNFTKENAAAILKKAKSLGKKAMVSSDIMSEDGKYVEVRVTLDPELITKTVRLDGYIRESQIFATESKFKKHFDNKTTVVALGQEGKFGQTAKIAAKVDLKDFNTANLFIYSYDKKANKYTLITSTDYKIDKNGYLVFNTDFGGDIIVSDGKLEKK